MNDLLTYKGYLGIVHYSANDDTFYGKIHGVNDLVMFEGDSVNELKDAFNAAVNDYLETCRELGKSPDKSYKGSFNVRMPSDLHRLAAITAIKKKMTLNEFVKTVVSEAVRKI